MRNYNYPESYTNIKEAFHDVIRHTKNLDVKDLFSFYLNQLEDYSQLKEPPNSFKIAKTVKSLYLKELFKFLFKVIKKLGARRTFKSERGFKGSFYYELDNLEIIRLSDHEIPYTEARRKAPQWILCDLIFNEDDKILPFRLIKFEVLNDLSLELLDIVADERYTKNRLGIKSEDYIRNTNLIIIKIGELLIKD